MIKKQTIAQYIVNYLSQMILLLAPMLTIPHVSRVLGAEQIGMYSYTQSYVSTVLLVCTLGMGLYAQRETATVMNVISLRSQLVYELLLLRLIAALFGITVYVLGFFYFSDGPYRILFFIQIIDLIAGILDIAWLFYAIGWYAKLAIVNISVKLGYVFCVLVFVKTEEQLWLYVLLHSLSILISNGLLCILSGTSLEWAPVKKINIKQHIYPVLLLFLPQVAIHIYTVLDKWMLGWIAKDMSQNGYYEQASKIMHTILMLITSFGVVMLSDNSQKKYNDVDLCKKAGDALEFIMIVAIPIMFGCISIAEEITEVLLGHEFIASSSLIRILAINVVFIATSNVIGIQYLLVLRRQKEYTVSIICGAFVNILLNCMFIPKWKAQGAAFASIIAEFVVLCVQMFFVRKDFVFQRDKKKNVIKCWISAVIMSGVLWLVNLDVKSSLLALAVKLIVGVVCYCVILVFLQEKYSYTLLKNVKMKFNAVFEKRRNNRE